MKVKVTSTGSTRYSCPIENEGEKTTDNGCTNVCNAIDIPNGVMMEKVLS